MVEFGPARPGGLVLLVLGLVVGVFPDRGRAGDRPAVETPVWVGTGSCAATACHGGRREPLALKGSEYTFFEAYDPHANAYSVLFDDRSARIEKNYRRLADLESARPYEDDACLRCHVHQGYDSGDRRARSPEFALADGVSCEGCHGPSGRWLVPHAEAGWRGLGERQKLDVFGMRPTGDLLARGQACAECHVGIGPADVNHDLIAAGHPRLTFEYGSQLAKLPKHWRVEDDKARSPDYEAKVWALGQLLTAKGSLDLLESRAIGSLPEDSTTPWPEFAEYSCFSCHHDLVQPGWPSANVLEAPKAGTLQWGTWPRPLAKALPPGLSSTLRSDDPTSLFAPLEALMAGSSPDARLVASRARGASEEIGRLAEALNRGRIAPDEIRSMLAGALRLDEPARPLDWDRAARQYLAIIALDKAASELDPRYNNLQSRSTLGRLRNELDLPKQADRRGDLFDSPYRFDPARIRSGFQSVRASLPNPGRVEP